MSNAKKFATRRAEQITKVALLNGGFDQVYENPDHNSDFVAISGQTGNQQFLVDVKVSKRPKQTMAAYLKAQQGRRLPKPLMLVVVDADAGRGVFKVVSGERESEILPLRRDELEQAVKSKQEILVAT